MEYEVNGFPARSFELPDGASVHIQAYGNYATVTWSTAQTPDHFLSLADEYLAFAPTAWASSSTAKVRRTQT